MKLDDVNRWLVLLANIGVIAGIVFLAVELQQNNALLGAQARTQRASVRISGAEAIASSPQLVDAIAKDRYREPLTREEAILLDEWYWGILARMQYVFEEYRRGLIEEEDLGQADWRASMELNPAMAKAWQQWGHLAFRPEFVEFMEENVVN